MRPDGILYVQHRPVLAAAMQVQDLHHPLRGEIFKLLKPSKQNKEWALTRDATIRIYVNGAWRDAKVGSWILRTPTGWAIESDRTFQSNYETVAEDSASTADAAELARP